MLLKYSEKSTNFGKHDRSLRFWLDYRGIVGPGSLINCSGSFQHHNDSRCVSMCPADQVNQDANRNCNNISPGPTQGGAFQSLAFTFYHDALTPQAWNVGY